MSPVFSSVRAIPHYSKKTAAELHIDVLIKQVQSQSVLYLPNEPLKGESCPLPLEDYRLYVLRGTLLLSNKARKQDSVSCKATAATIYRPFQTHLEGSVDSLTATQKEL